MIEKRIAVFIDYQNMVGTIGEHVKRWWEFMEYREGSVYLRDKSSDYARTERYSKFYESVWASFNDIIISQVNAKTAKGVTLEHAGTFITLAVRSQTKLLSEDRKQMEKMTDISQLDGFIVHYELKRSLEEESIGDGADSGDQKRSVRSKDWGVDANIACQMLLGAFRDQYDYAVLVSDDQDFKPVVEMLQYSYGRKVFHLGVGRILKAACYGTLDYQDFFQRFFALRTDLN